MYYHHQWPEIDEMGNCFTSENRNGSRLRDRSTICQLSALSRLRYLLKMPILRLEDIVINYLVYFVYVIMAKK